MEGLNLSSSLRQRRGFNWTWWRARWQPHPPAAKAADERERKGATVAAKRDLTDRKFVNKYFWNGNLMLCVNAGLSNLNGLIYAALLQLLPRFLSFNPEDKGGEVMEEEEVARKDGETISGILERESSFLFHTFVSSWMRRRRKRLKWHRTRGWKDWSVS